jgi:hypothetical protein
MQPKDGQLAKKVLPVKGSSKKAAKEFTVRLDAIRASMLDDLIKKKGPGQNGIVSIAISEMHEREFPDRKD